MEWKIGRRPRRLIWSRTTSTRCVVPRRKVYTIHSLFLFSFTQLATRSWYGTPTGILIVSPASKMCWIFSVYSFIRLPLLPKLQPLMKKRNNKYPPTTTRVVCITLTHVSILILSKLNNLVMETVCAYELQHLDLAEKTKFYGRKKERNKTNKKNNIRNREKQAFKVSNKLLCEQQFRFYFSSFFVTISSLALSYES